MSMKRAPYKGLRLPDDEIYLTVRLCFKAICMGNKPAAYLLSALLFRYDPDTSQDLEQVKQFRIQCSQESLIEAMCEECSTKTIHDAGIPGLQLFGYLEVDESTSPITYTVHMDRVRAMLNVYMSLKKQYPSDRRRLNEELEKVLIRQAAPLFPDLNKRNFHFALEKVLIRNRESSHSSGETSHSRRGRKPKQGAARDPKNVPPKNNKNVVSNKNEQEREKTNESFDETHTHLSDASLSLTSAQQQDLNVYLEQVCRSQALLPVGDPLGDDEDKDEVPTLLHLVPAAAPYPAQQLVHAPVSLNPPDCSKGRVPEPEQQEPVYQPEKKTLSAQHTSIPIAIGTMKAAPVQQEPEAGQGEDKPLAMPTGDQAWTPHTLLQVFEYHHGRLYPNSAKRQADRLRDVELDSCKVLHRMKDLWTGDTDANSAFLLRLITQQETRLNNWWLDHNGHLMPHQFVEKDRIHTMADEVARLDKKAQFSVVGRNGSGSQRGEDKPRRYSSFDDPDYDMSGEFYPSEAEKREEQQRHAAAVQ